MKERVGLLHSANIPFRVRELSRMEKRKDDPRGCVYCYAQTNMSLAVDGRGDCWPCSSLAGHREYYLGNIADGLPTGTGNAVCLSAPESCRNCPDFPLCRGGCPAGRIRKEHCDRLTCVMHRVLAE